MFFLRGLAASLRDLGEVGFSPICDQWGVSARFPSCHLISVSLRTPGPMGIAAITGRTIPGWYTLRGLELSTGVLLVTIHKESGQSGPIAVPAPPTMVVEVVTDVAGTSFDSPYCESRGIHLCKSHPSVSGFGPPHWRG